MGPYASGLTVQASHQWSTAGEYRVCVKAHDDNNSVDTEWSEPLMVTIYEAPAMEIQVISGGMLGVSTEIKNKGGVEATGVQWSMTFEGGILLMGRSSSGEISSIAPGELAPIRSAPVLGIGKTRITVTADIEGGVSDARNQGGFIFLFITIINPGGG